MELKGLKFSLPIKKNDAGKNILKKLKRALNNAAWAKATRPLLDGGKGENSVNIKFQWVNRRRMKRYVITVDCRGETRVRVQASRVPCETVRGAEEI